jgi:hypothetical protein
VSDAGQEYATLAARGAYQTAGHYPGGIIQITPLSGLSAPNVLQFRPRPPRTTEAAAGSTDGAA